MYMGSVLIKIYVKQTLIVAPDEKGKSSGPMVDYAEIVALSPDITDLLVGDIVIDFRTTEGFKWGENQYAVIPRMNIKLVVSKDNIDLKTKSNSKELKN